MRETHAHGRLFPIARTALRPVVMTGTMGMVTKSIREVAEESARLHQGGENPPTGRRGAHYEVPAGGRGPDLEGGSGLGGDEPTGGVVPDVGPLLDLCLVASGQSDAYVE